MTVHTVLSSRLAVVLAAAAAAGAAGCSNSTTAPPAHAPVRFQVAAATAPAAAASGLNVTSIQLVHGFASLGQGSEFGCHDCTGDHQSSAAQATLVTVPATGALVDVATDEVSAGQYSLAELDLATPTAAVNVPGAAPGTTVRVTGTYNGTPFQIDLAIQGSLRVALVPPVDVSATSGAPTVTVQLRLPVDTWFVAGGRTLDPGLAADRAAIEANIRASFSALESAEGPEREP